MKRCELCDSTHPDDVDQCECGSFCFTPEVNLAGAQLTFSEAELDRKSPGSSATSQGEPHPGQVNQLSEEEKHKFGFGLVAIAGTAVLWVLIKFIEKMAGDQARNLLNPMGNLGYGLFSLGIGLGLLVVGPIYISRVNRERKEQDRKPKYRLLEKTVIFVGGLVFTAVGIGLFFLK